MSSLSSFGIPDLKKEIQEHPERFEVIDLDLDEVVDNPFNPKHRQDVDEQALADILPSIRERGVVEPVIVVSHEELVKNSPELDAVTNRGRFVMGAGHRRKAASRLAKRATVPGIVRNEYASAVGLTELMLFENGGRTGLKPLEEAEGLQRLIDSGASYRDILERVGGSVRSTGQITKRVKLLKLTPLGKQLLNNDTITVADALHLLDKLPDDPHRQDRALTAATSGERGQRSTLKAAVGIERRRVEQEAEETARRAELASTGVPELDPQEVWGDAAWQHRLTTDDEIAAARQAGMLAGVAIVGGTPQYYSNSIAPSVQESLGSTPANTTTRPTVNDETAAGEHDTARQEVGAALPASPDASADAVRAQHERRQAHLDAAATRTKACHQLVREFKTLRDSHPRMVIEILADAVVAGGVSIQSMQLPEIGHWTGVTITGEDELDELMDDRAQAVQLALAAAVAVIESHAAQDQYADDLPWPRVIQRHVQRLADLGYHSPSDFEMAKLASA